jgi:hypothetical protein
MTISFGHEEIDFNSVYIVGRIIFVNVSANINAIIFEH